MIKQTQVHRKGRTKLANLREASKSTSSEAIQRATTDQTPNSNHRDWKDSGDNMNYKKAAEKKRLAGVLNHTHSEPDWRQYDSEPTIRRDHDGVSQGLHSGFRNRKERIQALR